MFKRFLERFFKISDLCLLDHMQCGFVLASYFVFLVDCRRNVEFIRCDIFVFLWNTEL